MDLFNRPRRGRFGQLLPTPALPKANSMASSSLPMLAPRFPELAGPSTFPRLVGSGPPAAVPQPLVSATSAASGSQPAITQNIAVQHVHVWDPQNSGNGGTRRRPTTGGPAGGIHGRLTANKPRRTIQGSKKRPDARPNQPTQAAKKTKMTPSCKGVQAKKAKQDSSSAGNKCGKGANGTKNAVGTGGGSSRSFSITARWNN